MGVIYTQGSDPATLEPDWLSKNLATAVREVMPWLASLSDADACRPEREGKWSAKQVIGHLTDSAVNNLGRIVRMQLEPNQHLPGYDQASWVEVQHYDDRDWPEVLGLWFALNEHIVWIIAHVEKNALTHRAIVAGGTITLGFLIEDYVAHMQHHLRALRSWVTVGLDAGGCSNEISI
jgi:hypothetical protein